MLARPPQVDLYIQRIHAVIGYVRENLDGDLSLVTLARVASISPYRFRRLFKSITGETVNKMIRADRKSSLL